MKSTKFFLPLIFIMLWIFPEASFSNSRLSNLIASSAIDFRLAAANSISSLSPIDFSEKRKIAIIATSSKCSSVKESIDFAKKIQKKFGHPVLLVDLNQKANRAELDKEIKPLAGSILAYLYDPIQTLPEVFGLKNIGDFAIVDLKKARILSTHKLSESLKIAAAECVMLESYKTSESFLQGFIKPFSVSCQRCHISDQSIDQFKTLEDVLSWKEMIKKTIRTGRMPGITDPYYAVSHEKMVSNAYLYNIYHWPDTMPLIDEKMREEFQINRKYLAKLNSSEPSIENPAQVLEQFEIPIPTNALPSGTSYYRYLLSNKATEKDYYVQSFILDTDITTSHHVIVYAYPPGHKIPSVFEKNLESPGMQKSMENDLYRDYWSSEKIQGKMDGKPAKMYIGTEPLLITMAKRNGVYEYPQGSYYFIPKGSTVAISIHSQSYGYLPLKSTTVKLVGQVDLTGLNFELGRFSINASEKFKLIPGKKNYVVESKTTIDEDMLIYSVDFHGHHRLKSAQMLSQDEKGNEEVLISLPFYQKSMDQTYFFPKEGILIKKGTRLVTKMKYDNSANNSANPNPRATIRTGGDTDSDEMHVIKIYYKKNKLGIK